MYQPNKETVEKYANLLVNFALNDGDGITTGDVVQIRCPEVAKPLYVALNKAVIQAGGHIIDDYQPSVDEDYNIKRDFYENASDEQLEHFSKNYFRGLIDEVDHMIAILAETNKQALKGVDPQKMMKRGQALKPYKEWRDEKEQRDEFSWTVAAYATESAAQEADLTLEEYWQEVIHACYLDVEDPVAEWESIYEKIDEITKSLNELPIKTVHVEAENIDLEIKIGEKRQWFGGGGRNMPSYEIFTSPDWRGTEGTIRFSEPLYQYGNLIKNIELTFEDGKVVEVRASKNEDILKKMIATDGADKVGEFSLTDRRFSRINHFMAETLFDENTGAEHGNTHIALGKSLKQFNYDGDSAELTEEGWEALGFNDSSVHTDIVSTEPRTATATLTDGSEVVIYKNGEFQV